MISIQSWQLISDFSVFNPRRGKFCYDVPMKPCAACGAVPVNHTTEWLSALLDTLLYPLVWPFEMISRAVLPLFMKLPLRYFEFPLARLLAWIGMLEFLREPDTKDSLRTKAIWESAAKRGISLFEFRLFGKPESNFFLARFGKEVRIFDGLPRPEHVPPASLDWLDDKASIIPRFKKAKIPVARGERCFTLGQAKRVLETIGPPLVVKPHVGSRSRHTTAYITNETELQHAFRIAKQLSPWAVVEEQLAGSVFRVTLIGGRVAGVLRRDPPLVLGNGKNTIRELIEAENKNPLRTGPIFHSLLVDTAAMSKIQTQGFSWSSVPKKGTSVILRDSLSRKTGGTTTDVTDSVHPENISLFEHAADVLNDSVVGIDFMIGDMEKSWRRQKRCGVIECNSLPFLDLHHYPFRGRARDVSGMLWELVFPSIK